MQATATLNTSNRRKLILPAIGIGLVLALTSTIFIRWNDGTEGQAISPPTTVNNARAAAEARFPAINELPAPASAARPAAVNYRFHDMNLLPERSMAAGMLTGLDHYRFLEWNQVTASSVAVYPDQDRDGRPN